MVESLSKASELVHYKRGKLDVGWKPYYVVVEKIGPVSYRIRDELTGFGLRPSNNGKFPLRRGRYGGPYWLLR